jgi:hypothetical protein
VAHLLVGIVLLQSTYFGFSVMSFRRKEMKYAFPSFCFHCSSFDSRAAYFYLLFSGWMIV